MSEKEEEVNKIIIDGKTYELHPKTNEVYEIKDVGIVIYIPVIFLILGILVGAYDYVKDIMRFFSGVKDLFGKGSGQSGVMKMAGFTVGNMQRYVIMVVLFILAFGGFYILSRVSRRKLSTEERDIVYAKFLMNSFEGKEKVIN